MYPRAQDLVEAVRGEIELVELAVSLYFPQPHFSPEVELVDLDSFHVHVTCPTCMLSVCVQVAYMDNLEPTAVMVYVRDEGISSICTFRALASASCSL